jgi:integrase
MKVKYRPSVRKLQNRRAIPPQKRTSPIQTTAVAGESLPHRPHPLLLGSLVTSQVQALIAELAWAVGSSLRSGDVLGLQRRDVDITTSTLSIEWSGTK